MDGYTDSAYRQIVKKINPSVIAFTEFFSADGLVRSRTLAPTVLPHHPSEKPLIVQIFGKDPKMFAEAAKIIESYGISGIDVNMGCPARKVVQSGHGSSLMIRRDTAYRIVEAMAQAVSLPISVKTRLGWEDSSLLVEFAQGLESAGANLLTVHGRTFQQAFTGEADWTAIHELRQHISIPILANGDVKDYDDGLRKLGELSGFMIGRASFGDPWCFAPGRPIPTLREVLDMMRLHAGLLIETKGHAGALESRKHLVQYLKGFAGARHYRPRLVAVDTIEDIDLVLADIATEHMEELGRAIVRG